MAFARNNHMINLVWDEWNLNHNNSPNVVIIRNEDNDTSAKGLK